MRSGNPWGVSHANPSRRPSRAKQWMLCASALLGLLLASPAEAHATETDAPRALPRGLFLGDDWRYQKSPTVWHWAGGIGLRSFADLVSMATNLDAWDATDYLTFLLTTSISVGATVPFTGRSLDARIQDELRRGRGPHCDYVIGESVFCNPPKPSGFHVWNRVSNTIIIATTLTAPLAVLLGGALGGQPELVEAGTLAIESYAVSQIYHVALKLFTGREGQLWHDGAGEFHGPSAAYFPDGWPSGHAATLFSIATTYATYFEQPWLRVLLLGTATFFATMLVVDDAHYASDVVLGAVIGYCTAKWVVRHRSSRYSEGPDKAPVRLSSMAPLSIEGGLGVAARFTY